MTVAYLGLGSNQDAERNIRDAVTQLRLDFDALTLSPVYRTAAVGFDGDDFLNLVARIDTGLGPLELKHYLNELEDRHGRRRNVPKFSDRTLDIDILLWSDLVLTAPGLQLPRPEIHVFAHVLRPLADLAPQMNCPGKDITFAELWAKFDAGDVDMRLVDPGFLKAG